METTAAEEEALRDRLAARERENLALVQSLHALKTQCSRLEGACQSLAARVAPEAEAKAVARGAPTLQGEVSASVDDIERVLHADNKWKSSVATAESSYDDRDVDDVAEVAVAQAGKEAGSRSKPFDTALAGAKADGDVGDQQGAAYWCVRAAKLEQLLGVAARKNLAFEDTVTRLEVQMRAMERHWEALHRDQPTNGRKIGVRSAKTTSKVSSAILSMSTAFAAPSVVLRSQETPALTTPSSRSEAMQRETERLRVDVAKRKQEAARLRTAAQRKGKLLAHEKEKTAKLQERLRSITSSADELVEAQTQCVELRAKVKEQARQLQDVRLAGSACHEDNVQLSFRLQQTKKELQDATARIKALQTENQRLRSHLAGAASGGDSCGNDGSVGSTSRSVSAKRAGRAASGSNDAIAVADEEVKALRRRVLQKHGLIMKFKAQIASTEEELARERALALKLEQANRQLQQSFKSQLATSARTISLVQTEVQTQLTSKQQQLDGLRASVFDVFEAFVCCFEPTAGVRGVRGIKNGQSALASNQNDVSSDSSSDDKLEKACRWTNFSLDDLATLQVTKSSGQRVRAEGSGVEEATLEAKKALKALEMALDRWPEDCRSEICRVLDSMFEQRRQR